MLFCAAVAAQAWIRMSSLDDPDLDPFLDCDDGSSVGAGDLPDGDLAWGDVPAGPVHLTIEHMDDLDTNEPLPQFVDADGDDGNTTPEVGTKSESAPPSSAPPPLPPVFATDPDATAPDASDEAPPAAKKRRLSSKQAAPRAFNEEAEAKNCGEMAQCTRLTKEFWQKEFHHVRDKWISEYCSDSAENFHKGVNYPAKRKVARQAWAKLPESDKRQMMIEQWRKLEDAKAAVLQLLG